MVRGCSNSCIDCREWLLRSVRNRDDRHAQKPDRFLATVQIGVTVISSFASAIGGAAAIAYLKPMIESLPFPFAVRWGQPLAILIVVLLIAYLSLVLCELVPKSLALRFPEQIALIVARPIDFLS